MAAQEDHVDVVSYLLANGASQDITTEVCIFSICTQCGFVCIAVGLRHWLTDNKTVTLSITYSARNLGFIFDERLTFSDQMLSKSYSYSHIRGELSCILPYLDSKTAIVTSIVHSKLNYCSSI